MKRNEATTRRERLGPDRQFPLSRRACPERSEGERGSGGEDSRREGCPGRIRETHIRQFARPLAQRAREHRNRADRAHPEHERPLDQVADAALEPGLECSETYVHLLPQLGEVRT